MKQKDLIFIFGSIFILVVAWIILSIYHNFVTSTIPEELSTQIAPIQPNFNVDYIKKIKERKKVAPIYNLNQQTPQNEATLNLPSTESAEINLNINNQASEEGSIKQ